MKVQDLSQVSEIKIHYLSNIKPSQRPKIETPIEACNIMRNMPEFMQNIEYKELFYAIHMNTAGIILSVQKIAEGTTNCVMVDIKHIFQGAILQNVSEMIVCHNHPSGNIQPSPGDFDITDKINSACHLFGIRLKDSMIITSEDFYSFRSNGYL